MEGYPILVVPAASLANTLFAAMFIARAVAPHWSGTLGLAGTAMALPLGAAAAVAVAGGEGVWAVLLPLVFVCFAAIEFVVDPILHAPVRASHWLWPYLGAFYAAQWATIGATFLASEAAGFIVLLSYFLCLGASFYSYRRVGHGRGAVAQ